MRAGIGLHAVRRKALVDAAKMKSPPPGMVRERADSRGGAGGI